MMKNLYFILGAALLVLTACSKSHENELPPQKLAVSLNYTDLYVTDKAEIEFEITSGNGSYQVTASDQNAVEATVSGTKVTVKFYNYAPVEIVISDSRQQVLTVPMQSLSDEIHSMHYYLSLRKGVAHHETLSFNDREGGYCLLDPVNEYARLTLVGNQLEILPILEGETKIRLSDRTGYPYTILLRVGDPDPAKTDTIVTHRWEQYDYSLTVGRGRITRVYLLWAKGDVHPFHWESSHEYIRIINPVHPGECPILEIVTAATIGWGGEHSAHFSCIDDEGNRGIVRVAFK